MRAVPKHLIGGVKVTDQELKFLKAYLNKGSKSYLDHSLSGKIAYNGHKDVGLRLIRKPRIMTAIKNLFSHPDYDTYIDNGMRKILRNPKDKNFTTAVSLVMKVRGDFAPEKSINMSMTPEDLQKETNDVIEALTRSENGQTEKIGLTGSEYRESVNLGDKNE